MSNLFSLIKESSLPSEMFASIYSRESYVESSIHLLESMNRSTEENMKALYKAIAEASDVKEENNAVKNFITAIKAQLTKLSLEMQSLESRFVISLDNYCDTVEATISTSKGRTFDSSVGYKDKYITFNKANMLNSSMPRMNPHSIFEREFNFIAQLMQDLPITASNKDKLNVVATVCDKFNSTMKSDIQRKVYSDLFGDENADDTGLSTYITSLFRGNAEEKFIGHDEYIDAVECISGSSDFTSSISEMNSKLISDLNNIISDLDNILSCGEKNKFKVDTKEDGIKNTIYSVDVYSSNKIMWLAQEKINQIINVYNKYILALSIKLECILAYVKQSSDIINSFNYLAAGAREVPSASDSDDESSDDEISGGETEYDVDNNSEEPVSDDEEVDLGKTDTAGNISDDSEAENTNDGSSTSEEESDSEEEVVPNFELEDDAELQEAFTDFYITMHEYSCAMHELNILESAVLLLAEEGEQEQNNTQPAGSGDGGNTNTEKYTNVKQMVGKIADKKDSIWKSVIKKSVELWNKFKDNIIHNYTNKVNYLKDNEKYIAMKRIDNVIEMPVINHANIDKIDIPDLNYNAMKEHLSSKEDFMKSQSMLSQFAPDKDKKVNQKVMEFVVSPDKKITNSNQIDPSAIYNEYCKNFIQVIDEIKKITTVIDKGRQNAERLALTIQESSVENLADMYFNEADFKADTNGDGKTGDNDSGGEKKSPGNTANNLKTYFQVCGEILAAKMNVSQKVFNEYNAYLVWHIKKKKGETAEQPQQGDQKNTANAVPDGDLSFA